MNIYCKFFLILIFAGLLSCNSEKRDKVKQQSETVVTQDVFIDAHKQAITKENGQIDDFLRRYHWNMKTTGTCLRYMIYEHGDGNKIKVDDVVTLEYSIVFLNGDTVYTSYRDGLKSFIVGHSNEAAGLEEALLLMNVGDKAKLIVPSFLAYGVSGDANKISIKNTLVYDIYVVNVK
ncbi:MAG: FKBP-type peptidyl-prolyl cis-trans isomerase [Bacteroidales bacterium]|nr:FKBP-type peptidyl-prolyl cis-trans isomerase [Bacteroidales bacterium]MDD2204913.1 FKBP-type peptidyl-prolyl cis-trans isomerase [Bacteroidales bacterium]MDD3152021.1 FKBP-type peptidyl-prolyl cis-trans isomerase [Bacteroidales bacterium]MDD3914536.1 FKBP-type peptidyl-prolyl cis-trans isomerase [Bacteroidales bacterium]MDD4634430.1 FKBP-type peptidyl-prolyl cis-trans isomerase [Bacteroidales bacterium]